MSSDEQRHDLGRHHSSVLAGVIKSCARLRRALLSIIVAAGHERAVQDDERPEHSGDDETTPGLSISPVGTLAVPPRALPAPP